MYHSDVVQFENLTGVWDLPRGCWFSCCLVWETDLSIVRHWQVCAREYSLACGLWLLAVTVPNSGHYVLRRCGGHELNAIFFSLHDLISLFGLASVRLSSCFRGSCSGSENIQRACLSARSIRLVQADPSMSKLR